MQNGSKFLAGLAGVAIAIGGATTTAHAYSYDQAIKEVWSSAGGETERAVGYRDSNFSSVVTIDETDYLIGYAAFTEIQAGDMTPPMRNARLAPDHQVNINNDLDAENPRITGLFFAEASAVGSNPEGGAQPHQYFRPASAGDYEINGETFSWNPQDDGALLQMFATGREAYDDAGALAQAFSNNSGGTFDLLSEIGMGDDFDPENIPDEGEVSLYDLGLPYFATQVDSEGPVRSRGNLAVLFDEFNLFPSLIPHDGGQDVHVNVSQLEDSPQTGWDFRGEGASVRFLIPTPAAAGPGLAMLGLLAFGRFNRRRQEA